MERLLLLRESRTIALLKRYSNARGKALIESPLLVKILKQKLSVRLNRRVLLKMLVLRRRKWMHQSRKLILGSYRQAWTGPNCPCDPTRTLAEAAAAAADHEA